MKQWRKRGREAESERDGETHGSSTGVAWPLPSPPRTLPPPPPFLLPKQPIPDVREVRRQGASERHRRPQNTAEVEETQSDRSLSLSPFSDFKSFQSIKEPRPALERSIRARTVSIRDNLRLFGDCPTCPCAAQPAATASSFSLELLHHFNG